MRFSALLFAAASLTAAPPFVEKEDIFPLNVQHNHGSSIVELPNGDLLTCWYRGSGERQADDVTVLAARKKKGAKGWSEPFVLADVPGFPDTNPVLWIDGEQRLWFFWQTIVANQWHTAVTQIRISSDYLRDGPPKWDSSQALFLKPRNIEERVKEAAVRFADGAPAKFWERMIERAGDKYFSRMGWMGRAKPLQLPSGRILMPLYSDGFSFSLTAISDDHGETWFASEPVLGGGGVQPSFARRKDGTILAYMRDNGPPPKRVLVSESRDNGETWSFAADHEMHNSGTGLEVQMLKDGRWLMINNDTERGRHRLTLSLSDDEGRSWKWSRALEHDLRPERASSFHYPSIMQGADGSIHASYSVFLNHLPEGQPRKTIRYARFNTEWVEAGNRQ